MDRLNHLAVRYRATLLVLTAVGLLAFAITARYSPQRAWLNLLLANFYFVSIALYGVVFVALTHIFSAGWAVAFRRVPEAMSTYLFVGALFMLALFFGRFHLYAWARPDVLANNPHLQHKAVYLNTPFLFGRMAVAFAVWILFSHLLRAHSKQQDADGDLAHTRKNQTYSAIFLLLFALTFIFTSIDWIMSLEPEWHSTIFPVYSAAGLLLGGTAAMAVFLIFLQTGTFLPGVTNHHIYELARIICATSTFWAYIWFSQYMLIYYTNIPDEAVYFVHRLTRGRSFLFLLNPVLNWLIPLVILIPASARRSPKWLLRACAIVLMGRWLDIYLLVVSAGGRQIQFGLPEVFIFLGFAALFILTSLRTFRAGEPVPRQDPYLVESLHMRV